AGTAAGAHRDAAPTDAARHPDRLLRRRAGLRRCGCAAGEAAGSMGAAHAGPESESRPGPLADALDTRAARGLHSARRHALVANDRSGAVFRRGATWRTRVDAGVHPRAVAATPRAALAA